MVFKNVDFHYVERKTFKFIRELESKWITKMAPIVFASISCFIPISYNFKVWLFSLHHSFQDNVSVESISILRIN